MYQYMMHLSHSDPADSRMRAAASARGIDIISRSRPLKPSDIEEFDLLICMVRTHLGMF
jgi:protein-tyrosine phosphatase